MSQEPPAPGPAVEVHLGMAAWGYEHLVGPLYPHGTPPGKRLGCYARVYPFVEVDNLRYAWPSDAPLADWRDKTPQGFRFVPKMHRSLTHGHAPHFGDAADWWAALAPLRHRIPRVLLQFPASFHHTPSNLARVLDLMAPVDVPCVVEVRHPSWAPTWPQLLTAGAVPCWSFLDGVPTATHAHPETGYVRVIGDRSIPSHEMGQLRRDRIRDLEALGTRVQAQPWWSCHVVVTNHFEGSAPLSIERIARAWGLDVPDRLAAARGASQAGLF